MLLEDPDLGIDGRPFVLAIGTFERRKSLPTLVAAFGHLADRLGDSVLVMAGAPGDDSARIAAAIDALPAEVRSRVICPGPVSDNAKGWLLKRSSVLVYPSLDEGFGFPILEAQAAGTPIVARRAGSIPEIGGDGVELVDGDDPGGLRRRHRTRRDERDQTAHAARGRPAQHRSVHVGSHRRRDGGALPAGHPESERRREAGT